MIHVSGYMLTITNILNLTKITIMHDEHEILAWFAIHLIKHSLKSVLGYSRLKMPSLHTGCQSLLPGNPDSKIVSKCGNPNDFCKSYLEIMDIVTKTWNLVTLYQTYLDMWSKNFLEFQSLKLLWKSVIPTSSMGGGHFLSGRAHC